MPSCVQAGDDAIKGGQYGLAFPEPKHGNVLAAVLRYQPWIDAYRGAMSRIEMGLLIARESGGDPTSTSDPGIQESGLCSLLPDFSKQEDIDPFDPEAAIWAAARLRNERVASRMKTHGWLKQANALDCFILTWQLAGSIGYGGVTTLLNKFWPNPPAAGSIGAKQPYLVLRNWALSAPLSVPKLGRQGPGIVTCRVVKALVIGTWLQKQEPLPPSGSYTLVPRPAHLPRWNAQKFAQVWNTPAALRPLRFPEYYRYPPGSRVLRPASWVALIALPALAGVGGALFLAWRWSR